MPAAGRSGRSLNPQGRCAAVARSHRYVTHPPAPAPAAPASGHPPGGSPGV